VLARYGVSGAAAVATDLAVFSLLTSLGSVPVVPANMIGFAVAGFVQFAILRSYVFKAPGSGVGTFVAFVLYALVSRYVSAVLQAELTETLQVSAIVSKILVDTSIFLINFLFLRDIIFRRWSDT
jgi:putative flippase GtrA